VILKTDTSILPVDMRLDQVGVEWNERMGLRLSVLVIGLMGVSKRHLIWSTRQVEDYIMKFVAQAKPKPGQAGPGQLPATFSVFVGEYTQCLYPWHTPD
jgi:hypothetical protein